MTSEQRGPPRMALPPNEITKFFWDAAKEHKLLIQRCDACGYYVHWPSVLCPRCGSDKLSPVRRRGGLKASRNVARSTNAAGDLKVAPTWRSPRGC